MYNRIRLAIAIIKTATMFVRDVKSAMIVPILFYVKLVLLFGFWLEIYIFMKNYKFHINYRIVGFVFIYSIGSP
jgi:hypothetical protein